MGVTRSARVWGEATAIALSSHPGHGLAEQESLDAVACPAPGACAALGDGAVVTTGSRGLSRSRRVRGERGARWPPAERPRTCGAGMLAAAMPAACEAVEICSVAGRAQCARVHGSGRDGETTTNAQRPDDRPGGATVGGCRRRRSRRRLADHPGRGRGRPRRVPARRGSPRSAPGTVALSLDLRDPGAAVPRRFLGLSFEVSSLPLIARYAHRGKLVTLLRSLGPGVLRFGGISADSTTWTGGRTSDTLWPARTVSAAGPSEPRRPRSPDGLAGAADRQSRALRSAGGRRARWPSRTGRSGPASPASSSGTSRMPTGATV